MFVNISLLQGSLW